MATVCLLEVVGVKWSPPEPGGNDDILGGAMFQAAQEQLEKLIAVWQRWPGWWPNCHAFPLPVVADDDSLCLGCPGAVSKRAFLRYQCGLRCVFFVAVCRGGLKG